MEKDKSQDHPHDPNVKEENIQLAERKLTFILVKPDLKSQKSNQEEKHQKTDLELEQDIVDEKVLNLTNT